MLNISEINSYLEVSIILIFNKRDESNCNHRIINQNWLSNRSPLNHTGTVIIVRIIHLDIFLVKKTNYVKN